MVTYSVGESLEPVTDGSRGNRRDRDRSVMNEAPKS